MRTIFKLLPFFLLTNSFVKAQVLSSEYDASFIYQYSVFPDGENSIAYVSSDKDGLYISKYDSTTKVSWEKDYVLPKKSTRKDYYNHHNTKTGADIYVLSFDEVKEKGGGSGLTITYVDGNTGESTSKYYPGNDFGHVLDKWSNSRYFFVRTTYYALEDENINKDPGMKLYRFDKKTLEMETLDHEMGNASQYGRVFWNFIRFDDNFVEGFVVDEVGQKVSLTLARFDNEGKKIKKTTTTFALKDENYTRQINMGGNNYIFTMNGTTATTILVYPTSSVDLIYCPDSKSYIAFGVCGPDEQKRIATKYTGFFVARMDSSFNLSTYKEHTNIPELNGDAEFRINAAPDSRRIDAYAISTNELIIQISKYRMTLDQRTLELKETRTEKKNETFEKLAFYPGTNRQIKPDKFLIDDDDVDGSQSRMTSFIDVYTDRWQFVFIQNYNSGKIKVFSEKI